MTENARSFGANAQAYAAGRPGYPDALFDWIAEQAPSRGAVWDCATGSGQAARSLASRFERVFATDMSADQLAAAEPHPGIIFAQAPAEASGLADRSVDAVTVATALHWFDFDRFWEEVRRVAKPGGLFCAWTYGEADAAPDVREHLIDPVLELVEPYWAEGNWLSLRGYPREEIKFPLEEIKPPAISLQPGWNSADLAAFIGTWSAVTRARDDGHAAALDALFASATKALAGRQLDVSLPLTIVAGRIG